MLDRMNSFQSTSANIYKFKHFFYHLFRHRTSALVALSHLCFYLLSLHIANLDSDLDLQYFVKVDSNPCQTLKEVKINGKISMDLSGWPILSFLSQQIKSTINYVVVFVDGNEAIFVTHDDQLYGISMKNVANGGEQSLQPKLLGDMCNKGVIDIRSGGTPLALALTKTGEVFSCTNICSPFTQVVGGLAEQKIVKISCAATHSVALSESGEVFFWGTDGVITHNEPTKIDGGITGKFMKDVECGWNFTLLLSGDDEQVYSWGQNEQGQLGNGTKTNQPIPALVPQLQDVKISQLACGRCHSLVLTDNGQVFGWGQNVNGELGTGTKGPDQFQCTPIRAAVEIGYVDNIAAVFNSSVSLAVTQNGSIYVWGWFRGLQFSKPYLTGSKNINDVFSILTGSLSSGRPLYSKQSNSSGKTLPEMLKNSFDDAKTSDITFVVEDKEIHAHKALLKIRCEHFRLSFQSEKDRIKINQFTYPVYKAFLYYMYTDELIVNPETAIGILDLATSYSEGELKSRAVEIIQQMISVESAILFYDASVRFKIKDLEDFCFRYCMEHTTEVAQTEHFSKLDETTLRHFVFEATKAGAFKK